MSQISQTPYDVVGGAAGVRRVVDRFYDLMDGLREAYRIRKLHPQDLSGSRDKLYWFLSGWLGGPQLYVERFGPPFCARSTYPSPSAPWRAISG